MFRENKLSKYLIASGILHIFVALAISRIYAEQPPRQERLMKAVRIEYKEVKPPPKPKVVVKPQPKKVAPKKKKPKPKEEPKIIPKVEPPKVTRRRRRMSASAPSLGAGTARRQSISAPGVAGIKGARGPVDELPTLRSSGGIEYPNVVTKVGGTGLTPDQTHGSMNVPTGVSYLPGAGGKEVVGFRIGTSAAGNGVGKLDVSGSGGRGGQAEEGPGTGLANFAGRVNTGGGKGTTGLGVGKSDGMGETDSESSGSKKGAGKGSPGLGGPDAGSSRVAPSLTRGAKFRDGNTKEQPGTEVIPEDKRDGATGKKEFEADAKTNMTSARQVIVKPEKRAFGDALQNEINRNLNGLRKMHEDWQNLKIPNVPKALQITVELDAENGKPKLLKLDLHNANIPSRIRDDLTKKVEKWKFKSLFDGKNDPKKWPIKLAGKISWQ